MQPPFRERVPAVLPPRNKAGPQPCLLHPDTGSSSLNGPKGQSPRPGSPRAAASQAVHHRQGQLSRNEPKLEPVELLAGGQSQLFYFAVASGTSHSPCRVLGTFRLPYLCPIGFMVCRGVLSEIHLRDRATIQSSLTQEDAAKDRYQPTGVTARGENFRPGFSPSVRPSKKHFHASATSLLPQGREGNPAVSTVPRATKPLMISAWEVAHEGPKANRD